MYKNLLAGIFLTSSICLTGCGGGGGGGGGAAPNTNTSVFQLDAAYINSIKYASTTPYTMTANVTTGEAVYGSGTIIKDAANKVSYVFEGIPVLQQIITDSGTTTVNGVTSSYSEKSSTYYKLNYLPVGYDSGEYVVVTNASGLPSNATVNAKGNIYTAHRYADSTKATPLGTESATYSLVDDNTGSTALLKIITVRKDALGKIDDTSTATFRITPDGSQTLLNMVMVMGNGDTITITYN